jgi:hypothetical protein
MMRETETARESLFGVVTEIAYLIDMIEAMVTTAYVISVYGMNAC